VKGRKGKLAVVTGGADESGCPGPPGWLTQHAAAEWRRAAPELHARKLLARDTMATLESYCVAAGLVRECEETMSRDGRFVTTDAGVFPHPAFRMQASAMREVRLHAAELGLTPHRRGKQGPEAPKKSAMSAMIA
jgi:P27 family predicted phage terminase small subunit